MPYIRHDLLKPRWAFYQIQGPLITGVILWVKFNSKIPTRNEVIHELKYNRFLACGRNKLVQAVRDCAYSDHSSKLEAFGGPAALITNVDKRLGALPAQAQPVMRFEKPRQSRVDKAK